MSLGLGCQSPGHEPTTEHRASTAASEAADDEDGHVPLVTWAPGPDEPAELGVGDRPRVVRLTAAWCQWCRMLEHDVLPQPGFRRALARHFESLEVDVDRSPRWMDLPGVEGLPALVFFDAAGRHVLSRSGYRDAGELETMLEAIARGMVTGDVAPYPSPPPPRRLGDSLPIDAERARAELERLEGGIFLRVNSHDGGFGTPSRDPQPAMLLELQRWARRSERAEQWITLTIQHALRGSSPRLLGESLPDLTLDAHELTALSSGGPAHPRWRAMVEALPGLDPYRGLQDPVDHGVFRYCAGPGWYHPHFERRAIDNLAWALLLRERGEVDEAAAMLAFVETTFGTRGPGLDAAQRSDPFHARLRADERVGVVPPLVDPLQTLATQALAAQLEPERCAVVLALPVDSWPPAQWPVGEASAPATVDAVGETLLALAGCRGGGERATTLARLVLARWREEGFEPHARLARLAAGVCGASPRDCSAVLGAIEGLPLDLDFPPPLQDLARIAGPEH